MIVAYNDDYYRWRCNLLFGKGKNSRRKISNWDYGRLDSWTCSPPDELHPARREHKNRRYKVMRITRVIGTVFVVVATPIFLLGVLALISPTGFVAVVSRLPMGIQDAIFNDMLVGLFWGSTSYAWSYILGGGILGGVGLFLRGRR